MSSNTIKEKIKCYVCDTIQDEDDTGKWEHSTKFPGLSRCPSCIQHKIVFTLKERITLTSMVKVYVNSNVDVDKKFFKDLYNKLAKIAKHEIC